MDDTILNVVVPILISLIASSGFWLAIMQKFERRSIQTKLLIGLAHDKITYLGLAMISKGWASKSDYETLHDYLYAPYLQLGGNGSVKRIMEEVNKLPIRHDNGLDGNNKFDNNN
jgi:hypothetical protein